ADLLVVANPQFQPAAAPGDSEQSEEPRGIGALARDLFGVRSGLAPLAGAEREGKELQRLFPKATLLEGEQAQEAVIKREASKYRYLHFATHGLLLDAAPMQSSIVLAQRPLEGGEDGFLTARELFEMNLAAELVVLSACDTERGEKKHGE